jgi:two-component system response regulator PrrA
MTDTRRVTSHAVTTILVAADAEWVRNQVRTAFVGPGQQVVEVTRGQAVKGAVDEHDPDLVVLDMQIANMGGVAVAIDLRNEESGGRLPHSTILLLLDREADRFIAARADVDAVLVKPVDPGTLRRTAKSLLAVHAEVRRAAEAWENGGDDVDPPSASETA